MAILVIGQSAVDLTLTINQELIENQKYVCDDLFQCAGGPAFNAAYLNALWKEKTYLISRIGNDQYGDYLKQLLDEVGVDYSCCIQGDKIRTPYSIICSNVSNGSRTLFNFPFYNEDEDYCFPDDEIDVILTDGHERDITLSAFKRYPNAIRIIDAGTCRKTCLELSSYVDYLVCSQDYAQQYLNETLKLNHINELHKQFEKVNKINQKHLIITLGENGLLYRNEDGIQHMPAYRTKVIDSCGAGDIFHGVFAYGISNKMEMHELLSLASMSASISIEKIGSQSSIVEKEVVEERIKEYENNNNTLL